MHDLEDVPDLYRRLVHPPAVVVGDHADQRVRQLRLARELGLRHRGHADDAAAPTAVQLALRPRRELRPLHRQISAAARRLPRCIRDQCRQPRAYWIGHRDMRHHARAEKALGPREGPVDELVDHHKPPRRQLLAQRANGGDRHDVGAARTLQHVDVRPVVELARRHPVPAPMPRQERQLNRADPPAQQSVRRLPPRRGHRPPLRPLQRIDGVQPRAADDPDLPARHALSFTAPL